MITEWLFAIIGVVVIIWGIVQLAAPKAIWSIQEWENDLEGEASRHSSRWETGRVLKGVWTIIIGVVLFVVQYNLR